MERGRQGETEKDGGREKERKSRQEKDIEMEGESHKK